MSAKHCTSCGLPIPEGQLNSCSMCYGDIGYGTDGYYQAWAEDQYRQEAEREQASLELANRELEAAIKEETNE